ncbi:MAG: hypothetical protein B7Y72_02645 [Mehylophilales bacterium 35-46-6]|nr:MAG: hypothetical protein B7Y72_02645 [Mehylophilales bacterium 35-46-6]
MAIEFNAATILGYVLTALVGLIAWMMKTGLGKLSDKIEALEREDKRLSSEIHKLELSSISAEDLKGIKSDMDKNFDRIYAKLEKLAEYHRQEQTRT